MHYVASPCNRLPQVFGPWIQVPMGSHSRDMYLQCTSVTIYVDCADVHAHVHMYGITQLHAFPFPVSTQWDWETQRRTVQDFWSSRTGLRGMTSVRSYHDGSQTSWMLCPFPSTQRETAKWIWPPVCQDSLWNQTSVRRCTTHMVRKFFRTEA